MDEYYDGAYTGAQIDNAIGKAANMDTFHVIHQSVSANSSKRITASAGYYSALVAINSVAYYGLYFIAGWSNNSARKTVVPISAVNSNITITAVSDYFYVANGDSAPCFVTVIALLDTENTLGLTD